MHSAYACACIRVCHRWCGQLLPYAWGWCSILYQRGVYPAEAFKTIRKYGTLVVAADDPGLERYLKDVTKHMQSWLMRGQLQQFTLVLCNKVTKEVLERWVFMIETDEELVQGDKCAP
jgi:mitotic spindle assembly checkpoint protein MAD2